MAQMTDAEHKAADVAEEQAYRDYEDRALLQHALTVLPPGFPADTFTVAQAMVLAVLSAHRKGVTKDFFENMMDDFVKGVSFIECIKAETRYLDAFEKHLPPDAVAAMRAAQQLSMKEISSARKALFEKCMLLTMCKQDGVTLS